MRFAACLPPFPLAPLSRVRCLRLAIAVAAQSLRAGHRRRAAAAAVAPRHTERAHRRPLLPVLLGDVALQRGEASLAARAYLEAARESRDPRLARRATEIALAARMRASRRIGRDAVGAARPVRASGRSRCSPRWSRPAPRASEVPTADSTTTSSRELEKAARRRGVHRPRRRRDVPAAQPLACATQLDKRQVYELVRDLAQAVSEQRRRRISPSRSPHTTRRAEDERRSPSR